MFLDVPHEVIVAYTTIDNVKETRTTPWKHAVQPKEAGKETLS